VHPLLVVIVTASVASAVALIASWVTRDYSWVDRAWSILPVIYVGEFAGYAKLRDPRLDLMALVVLVWGARLTFNLARKGGYRGVEDYRWAILRSRMSPWQYQLFNLFFIVIYQNAILVVITLPAWTAYQHRPGAYGALDAVLALAFLACTAGETLADEQQWRFQSRKAARVAVRETPVAQFLTEGLFRYSRHPAYFFEIAQWWLLFFMGAAAAGSIGQWTVIGAGFLTLLFVGSTRFTEEITLAKYPEYRAYQQRTSAVVPWPPRREASAATTGFGSSSIAPREE
jgi:steroid 5-alpha reductase family enzyme